MAEFPYAEYYSDLPVDTMSRDAFMQAVTALGPGAVGGIARGFKALRGRGVARVREAMATRRSAEAARAAQTGGELEELVRKLGGRMGPGTRPEYLGPYGRAAPRVGRNPVGRPDLPSEELMPSPESPGGRIGFGRLRPKPKGS